MYHTLSTLQLAKLANAVGDGNDWPKFTDDAKVNHAVDCLTAHYIGDSEPEFDESYQQEVELTFSEGL